MTDTSTLSFPESEALSDEKIVPVIAATPVENQSSSMSDYELKDVERAWSALIEDLLLEWLQAPEAIEEEGVKAPSPIAIKIAGIIAQSLAKKNIPTPTTISPDGEGGIGFEWHLGGGCELLEIDADGSIELVKVGADNLVTRESIK